MAAACAGDRRPADLADPAVLRRRTPRGRCCRPRSAATRGASSRPRAATPAGGATSPRSSSSSEGSEAPRRSRSGRSASSSPSAATTSAPTSGSRAPSSSRRSWSGSSSSRAPRARCSRRVGPSLLAPPRAAAAGVLRRRPRTTAGTPGLLVGVFAYTTALQAVRVLAIWAAAGGRRDRALAAHLLRHGPALLPRAARAVHAQRDRRARGVLRQLPRERRRRRRRGVRRGLPVLPRHDAPRAAGRADPALGGGARPAREADSMADGSRVVVVTHNALPWIERCLESVRGIETVVVDNGSTDGTVDVVRERFPSAASSRPRTSVSRRAGTRASRRPRAATSCPERRRLARRRTRSRRLVDAADAIRARRSSAPRLLNPDGSLQRSVRGFPTAWRLATEYFYLRKLAPRSRALNAFYGGGFDHASEREVGGRDGRVHARPARGGRRGRPVRRGATSSSARRSTGAPRSRERGWTVVFSPGAECVHVGGASHGGRLFRENVRGHLRFLAKHGGAALGRAGTADAVRVAAGARARSTAASAGGCTARRRVARLGRRRQLLRNDDVLLLAVRLRDRRRAARASSWRGRSGRAACRPRSPGR